MNRGASRNAFGAQGGEMISRKWIVLLLRRRGAAGEAQGYYPVASQRAIAGAVSEQQGGGLVSWSPAAGSSPGGARKGESGGGLRQVRFVLPVLRLVGTRFRIGICVCVFLHPCHFLVYLSVYL